METINIAGKKIPQWALLAVPAGIGLVLFFLKGPGQTDDEESITPGVAGSELLAMEFSQQVQQVRAEFQAYMKDLFEGQYGETPVQTPSAPVDPFAIAAPPDSTLSYDPGSPGPYAPPIGPPGIPQVGQTVSLTPYQNITVTQQPYVTPEGYTVIAESKEHGQTILFTPQMFGLGGHLGPYEIVYEPPMKPIHFVRDTSLPENPHTVKPRKILRVNLGGQVLSPAGHISLKDL